MRSENFRLASETLEHVLRQGVQEFCVCPGKRNAPWVILLSQLKENSSVRVSYFFEERSAAFFALGRMKVTRAPVAVVVTSGTAAGELLPATMEAFYSELPLVLMTADRPKHYRGSGAPQSAHHVGIFSSYVQACYDLDRSVDSVARHLAPFRMNEPVQLNVCFEEPLGEGMDPSWNAPGILEEKRSDQLKLPARLSSVKRMSFPLVIVGELHQEQRPQVLSALQKWRLPCYLEGLSGLRESQVLTDHQVIFPEGLIERATQRGYPVDGIIRIGAVPTLRPWRDLDERFTQLPVLSLSTRRFSGLGRASQMVLGPEGALCEGLTEIILSALSSRIQEAQTVWMNSERELRLQLEKLLVSEPSSEPGLVFQLSHLMSQKSRIFIGNSLPIREWDLAAIRKDKGFDMEASRGLSGIDGQVSTFLGTVEPHRSNWGIFGDLTALYDLAAPWIISQRVIPSETDVNIVVINNGGGKIFSRMFSQKEFQNLHQVSFKPWADLWGLDHQTYTRLPENLNTALGKHRLLELIPDPVSTEAFWKKYRELLKK